MALFMAESLKRAVEKVFAIDNENLG